MLPTHYGSRILLKPLRYATGLAFAYLLVAGGYILVSGRLAAAVATSVVELQRIENIKGIVYVFVTGALLWIVSYGLFARIERAHESHALDRRAMMLMQSKAYAAELAAAVAHDFNNLLMVVGAGVHDIQQSDGREIDPATLASMQKAVDSARDLTARMARAARGARSVQSENHCLADLIDETVRLLRRLPRLYGRSIELATGSRARVFLDAILVEQIVVNLLLNAADAGGPSGRIRVEVEEDAQTVWVAVHDSGTGLTEPMLRGIFEPFQSTKETGLGLGLLSVRVSVEASQGKLTAGPSPLGGARFEVRWNKVA